MNILKLITAAAAFAFLSLPVMAQQQPVPQWLGSLGSLGTVFGCNTADPLCAPFQGGQEAQAVFAAVGNYTDDTPGKLNSSFMGTAYATGSAGSAGATGNGIALGPHSLVWGFNGVSTVGADGASAVAQELQVQMMARGRGYAQILEFGDNGVPGAVAYQIMRDLGNGVGGGGGDNAPDYGIMISGDNYTPVNPHGTLIGVTGNRLTAAYGIDLRGGYFVSSAFASPNFNVSGSGAVTAASYGTVSDRRLKHDVQPLDFDALTTLQRLHPVQWRWNDSDKPDVGFVAQQEQADLGPLAEQVHAVLPGKIWARDDTKLVPLLVAAIQELSREVEDLKQQKLK